MKINMRFFLLALFLILSLSAGIIPAIAAAQKHWPRLIYSGQTTGKYIALTFDDSPMVETPDLLRLLDELDIKATFFVTGSNAEVRPEILKSIVESGHEIGNHTYSHPNVTKIDSEELENELNVTNDIIRTWTGVIVHLFRPPGGNISSKITKTVYDHDMTTVLWTANGADCTNISASRISSRVLRKCGPGGIILLHDGLPVTRDAVRTIVETLRGKGYTFVTVGEMIEMTYGECPWPDQGESGTLKPDDLPTL
ncbi:MAG: polysaccharide deacetylase family protein [bacterium]